MPIFWPANLPVVSVANGCMLYSPAIFTDPAVLQGFREEAVRHVFEMYEHLDTVVFGIGTLDNSQSTAVRLRLRRQDDTGCLLEGWSCMVIFPCKYYDKDGNTEPYRAYNERVAGLQLPAFKKKSRGALPLPAVPIKPRLY